MAQLRPEARDLSAPASSLHIVSFRISGGIFGETKKLVFPVSSNSAREPNILILSGKNGSGKTTILRMLFGIQRLDFDVFRQIPFLDAALELSDGSSLTVHHTGNPVFPLDVRFGFYQALLHGDKSKADYSVAQQAAIDVFRQAATPILGQLNIELLDIHRSFALRTPELAAWKARYDVERNVVYRSPAEPPDEQDSLSSRVRNFVREAQVNYRKFFAADELELLPRILERFDSPQGTSTPPELLARIRAVQAGLESMKRFGLQSDDADLKALSDVLLSNRQFNTQSLTLIEAYVEQQENRAKARELIANRLLGFESIMDDFLVHKTVRIDARSGLQIKADEGPLKETQLSSGEYHFLYMMVAALLCQRSGTLIAIDEPELSLHAEWQRKVVGALTKCAAGASPTFLFATHSAAISAQYSDKIYSLTPVE